MVPKMTLVIISKTPVAARTMVTIKINSETFLFKGEEGSAPSN